MTRLHARVAVAVAAALAATGSVAAAPHATASTPPGPGITMSRTVVTGEGFDVCDAPPTSQMRSWLALPFRTVNIYFAGSQRHCSAQPELSPSWVTTVMANGWHIIPTVVDLQAPCYGSTTKKKMSRNRSTAHAQGAAAAVDAISGSPTSLTTLGFPKGSIAYVDIEHYNVPSGDRTCVPAVRSFLSGWTAAMHNHGYRSGVYSTPTSGIRALVGMRNNDRYPQPDAIWFARYDGVSTTSSPDIPRDYLPGHRIKQYYNYNASYLGFPTVNIDKDRLHGDVMTRRSLRLPAANSTTIPGMTYYSYAVSTSVATGETLKERTAPTTTPGNSTVIRSLPNGAEIDIVCQATGTPADKGGTVHGDYVWDKLTDGNFVSDLYTNTTGGNGFSNAIPRCDTTGPTTTMTTLGNATLRSSTTFSYLGRDPSQGTAGDVSGVATYDVRWRRASDTAGYGPWHQPPAWQHTRARSQTAGLRPGFTYCFSARATDRSGNTGRWAAPTCIARATDDRALAAGPNWHRGTGSVFYLGTVTTATRHGASVTRSGVQARRIGIVATTCPKCGAVRVYVGSTPIADIDLTSSSSHRRAIRLLPAFSSLRTGTVRVRIRSATGIHVQIDGLVTYRG
ncbi:MAG TPA: glycoside hydrolase domain-containing protein [Mycobacteriales bacterium]|nr:glycoside hydrolase domain-containing protein [Mycobacteriales bacterium]